MTKAALDSFSQATLSGPRLKVGVIGDVMIDEYYTVKVKKISPEFPIPVMASESDARDSLPGGAGNVAYQFDRLNVDVEMVALLDSGAQVCLEKHRVGTSFSLGMAGLVPRKRRFYSDGFPTYRWDVERPVYGLGSVAGDMLDALGTLARPAVPEWDVVVFSDYDKGLFDFDLHSLVKSAKISVVDPKCGDLSRWTGCTVFKPNAGEALAFTGAKTVEAAARQLFDRLDCGAVVVTNGGGGVSVMDGDGYHVVPAVPWTGLTESVIGAGDCFTAYLAAALARGFSVREAAGVAYHAGAKYVTRRKNLPVDPRELSPSKKNLPDGREDFNLVAVSGNYSILTPQDVTSLQTARRLGDKLLVGVFEADDPVVTDRRVDLVAALDCVDYVAAVSPQSWHELKMKLRPAVRLS